MRPIHGLKGATLRSRNLRLSDGDEVAGAMWRPRCAREDDKALGVIT
jgi:hypothetical protein